MRRLILALCGRWLCRGSEVPNEKPEPVKDGRRIAAVAARRPRPKLWNYCNILGDEVCPTIFEINGDVY